MDDKTREAIEKIKDIPGLKIGWVLCSPMSMTVDSEVLEYECAKRLWSDKTPRHPDWLPDRMVPVFWISEDDEPDEYSPSESLKD